MKPEGGATHAQTLQLHSYNTLSLTEAAASRRVQSRLSTRFTASSVARTVASDAGP